jgi:uncharacterized alkaline shock family protein YloU
VTAELVVPGEGGTVTVTPGALTQIVVGAAEPVAGARVRRRRRGLDVTIADGRACVQLELAARYGVVLPELARDVQERVAEALGAMCGVDVERVDVSVEELD